jgi:hypothetical protein
MRPLFFLTILLLSGAAAKAQSYFIAAGVVNGGGGISSGTGAAGSFTITGAIGQQAWLASTGDSYSLSGGFFSQYIALQQTGAPRLVIRPNGTNVEVAWPATVPGWVLQQNSADLDPAGWTDVVGNPTVSGPEQFHPFAASGGRVFFRLRKL